MNKENFYRELQTAVNNLREYRPRNNGKRERRVRGIRLEVLND
jgi:hypothetical protein